MNWLLKVAAFKLLSGLPLGEKLYRFSQEKITRSLSPTPDRVRGKIDVAFQYWDWLKANDYQGATLPGSILDFGSGWHPTIPLLYYSLGVERQYLCDVRPVMNRNMLDQTLKTFLSIVNDPQRPYRSRLLRLPNPNFAPQFPFTDCLKRLGMSYHAPSMGLTEQIAGSIDLVTSTQVLLHIPYGHMLSCFRDLHRRLKAGGKFLATVYLYDLNATAKNGLSQYNHLRYSPAVWDKWLNSGLMYFNRLKARDYRELLERAGFTIRHFDIAGPTPADLADLARLPVHPCFSRFTQEELGAKNLFFVAEKK